MHYEGEHIIRPPSEADSIILQVTVGCSHNRCTFCGTYKAEKFRIKDEAIVDSDLAFAQKHCKRQKRVFLADGDVLSLSQTRLTKLFTKIKTALPWVNRISLYGNAKGIRQKTVADLSALKKMGLSRVYLGMESGSDPVLEKIDKGATSKQLIEAAQLVNDAGLFLSVTALLGIGGRDHSLEHAKETGKVLSQMQPKQIGVLTLMLLSNTPLYKDEKEGRFALPDQRGFLAELQVLVQHLELIRCQFQSNHASNYLPINARLPRDKETILQAIDLALGGQTSLKPEFLRAL